MCERCRADGRHDGTSRVLTQDEVAEIRARMLTDENAGPFGSRYVPIDWNGRITKHSRVEQTKDALQAIFDGVLDTTSLLRNNRGERKGGLTLYVGLADKDVPDGAKEFDLRFRQGHILFHLGFWRFRLTLVRLDMTRLIEAHAIVQTQFARIIGPATYDAVRLMHPSTGEQAMATDAMAVMNEALRAVTDKPIPPTGSPRKPTPPVS